MKLSTILNRLYPDPKPKVQAKIQYDEGDWVTIQMRMCRTDRIELVDCIETSGEISLKLLNEFSELIRTNQLNKDSWAAEDMAYYKRMFDLAMSKGN